MIRRTQQRAAEPAAGDVREISLERFSLRHLHRVEIVARVCKGAALENAAIGSDSAGRGPDCGSVRRRFAGATVLLPLRNWSNRSGARARLPRQAKVSGRANRPVWSQAASILSYLKCPGSKLLTPLEGRAPSRPSRT